MTSWCCLSCIVTPARFPEAAPRRRIASPRGEDFPERARLLVCGEVSAGGGEEEDRGQSGPAAGALPQLAGAHEGAQGPGGGDGDLMS